MLNGRREPRRMRYSLESRLRIVRLIERGETPARAAAAYGASRASGYRLWQRYQAEGWQGLADRRSTPKRQPRRLSSEEEARILALRRELAAGPQVIAVICGRPPSTVGKVLRRAGCSRLPRPERVVRPRYERDRPGELLHVDVKKLGRFWQVGNASTATTSSAIGTSAGAISTSRSTTTPAWPTPSCSKTSAAQAAPRFSDARQPGTPNAESRSSACSPTTPRPTTAATGNEPAPSSRSGAATHAHTAPGRTAKPKR